MSTGESIADFVPPDEPLPEVETFPCGVEGCDYVADTTSKRGVHRFSAHGIKSAKPKKAAADKAPTSVTVNLGSSKPKGKDSELAAVEERAKQLMVTVSALLLLMGQPLDSADLAKGADPWAQSVRELAQYEDWLRKLAAGGDVAGRTMAWVNVLLMTLGIIVPILARHGALPEGIAEMAKSMFGVAEGLGQPGDDGDLQQAA